ncbi:MAG: hypothetical protein ACQESH_06570 [Campylobacterota bacterium]
MNDKYLLILNTLIKEFIRVKDPIGSEQLKHVIDTQMSSATIRYYFKKMTDEGQIEQLHRSGGRIPADETLYRYWNEFFDSFHNELVIDVSKLENFAAIFDMYVSLKQSSSNLLKEVKNIDNTYLLVIFENDEIAVRYNRLLEKFLNDFLDNEIEKIAAVVAQIGIEQFAQKINSAIASNIKVYNKDKLWQLAACGEMKEFESFYDGSIINKSLHMQRQEQLLKVKLDVVGLDGTEYELFIFGELTNDFKNFIRSISGTKR